MKARLCISNNLSSQRQTHSVSLASVDKELGYVIELVTPPTSYYLEVSIV